MTTPVTPVGYSTPYTSNTTQSSGLGAAAAPYGQDVMAQSYALASQDPYHAYTGQTVAGPTGLQQTAANSVSGLDAGALAQQGTALTQQAAAYNPTTANFDASAQQQYASPNAGGLASAAQSVAGLNAGSLDTQGTALTQQGANYTPTNATFDSSAAQSYMNPYQQNVVDVANKEAARSSDIQGTYDASKAAQAGAFGGSRDAIVNAERERNLAMLQNNNTMQGQAAAYTNAQQQFNADQTRNQQAGQYASQAALAGGNALTAQGAQALNQQTNVNSLQQAQLAQSQAQFNADQARQQQAGQFAAQTGLAAGNALTSQGAQAFNQQQVSGGQQQAAAQGDLTQDKANFTGAVQHPYDQLNFMTNQIKAMPGSTTSSDTTYTPDNSASQPTGIQQAAGAASGVAGLLDTGMQIGNLFGFKGFAHGGMVPARAGLPQARIAQLYGKM